VLFTIKKTKPDHSRPRCGDAICCWMDVPRGGTSVCHAQSLTEYDNEHDKKHFWAW